MEVIRKKADNKLKLMSPGRDKVLLSNPILLYKYFTSSMSSSFFVTRKNFLQTTCIMPLASVCLRGLLDTSWFVCMFVCLYVCMFVWSLFLGVCYVSVCMLVHDCMCLVFVRMLVCISMSLFVCLCMFVCVFYLCVCASVSVFVSAWLCLSSMLVWVTVCYYCLSIFVCLLFFMIMSAFVFLSVCVFVCKHSTYVRSRGLHVHIECHSVILLSTR